MPLAREPPVEFAARGFLFLTVAVNALLAAASENELCSAFVDRDPDALTKGRPALARFDCLPLVGLKPFQVPVDADFAGVAATANFMLFEVGKARTF